MEAHSIVQILAGVTVILGQFIIIIFFVAKIHSQTNSNTEKVRELKTVVDDHIKDKRIHQDMQVQSVQFGHIEEKMNALEKRLETMSVAFDELKTLIIERGV